MVAMRVIAVTPFCWKLDWEQRKKFLGWGFVCIIKHSHPPSKRQRLAHYFLQIIPLRTGPTAYRSPSMPPTISVLIPAYNEADNITELVQRTARAFDELGAQGELIFVDDGSVDDTGAVIEVISVSRDITARVESEENNRRLADELAHTARLATLGELASSIAHEMNQPLATIVNFACASQRYLKSARTNPECLDRVDDGLQKIVHHANRASEVIKRLRAFLRKGQKRTAPISLNDVVTNVARLCQWEAEKNNVRIYEKLARCAPVITADPVLLEQVLINLIRNGIEATVEARGERKPGSPSQIVITTCVNDQNETLIEVTDEGPGLDEQGIRQMFQPFYTSKPQGLGLGLSMSRSIIEGFGGFLDARPAATGGRHCLWTDRRTQG